MNSGEKREVVVYRLKEGALETSTTKTEVASQPQPSERLGFPLSLLDATAYFIVSGLSRNLLGIRLQKSRRLHSAFMRLREAKMRRDADQDSGIESERI